MSGRRSHPRVAVSPAAQGTLRLLRDVVVQHVAEGEIVAISRQPATNGEVLALEISTGLGGAAVERLQCRVIESIPLMVDRCLRHRLRLQAITQPTDRIVPPVPRAAEHQ